MQVIDIARLPKGGWFYGSFSGSEEFKATDLRLVPITTENAEFGVNLDRRKLYRKVIGPVKIWFRYSHGVICQGKVLRYFDLAMTEVECPDAAILSREELTTLVLNALRWHKPHVI